MLQVPVPSCPGLSAADPASAALDFNKKHIMVSNALSGLHYGPRASLAPVVPCDFISDEPYLLSKRFHLNSINLSKLPSRASAAERFPAWCQCCCPGRGGHLQPCRLRVSGGLGRDPPQLRGQLSSACSWALSRASAGMAPTAALSFLPGIYLRSYN